MVFTRDAPSRFQLINADGTIHVMKIPLLRDMYYSDMQHLILVDLDYAPGFIRLERPRKPKLYSFASSVYVPSRKMIVMIAHDIWTYSLISGQWKKKADMRIQVNDACYYTNTASSFLTLDEKYMVIAGLQDSTSLHFMSVCEDDPNVYVLQRSAISIPTVRTTDPAYGHGRIVATGGLENDKLLATGWMRRIFNKNLPWYLTTPIATMLCEHCEEQLHWIGFQDHYAINLSHILVQSSNHVPGV